jgi:hypothetical protein
MAKLKIEMKVECLQQNNTGRGSNANFIERAKDQPAQQPGEPPRIAARRTAQFNWDDATGRQLDTSKQYKITIEEL